MTQKFEKIVIAGGTGFIGRHLVREFHKTDTDIVVLTRSPGHRSGDPDYHHVRLVQWSPEDSEWIRELEGADAVINLVGKNLAAGRWTRSVKEAILQSRIESVRMLTEAVESLPAPPNTFIQASAVGFYGNRTDINTTEATPPGRGFLADVCTRWEAAARPLVDQTGMRTVILRFGVVLGIEDGFYRKMACMVRRFMGSVPGPGDNWISWIYIRDLIAIITRCLHDSLMRGIYNAVAPEPVQSSEFMHMLAATWSRPVMPSPPMFILRLALGDMLDELILASQHVIPDRLQRIGHDFEYSNAESALTALHNECRKRSEPVECPSDL
ncbi:MAG TPA: TIGR01777 family oxidoreductase [bacterium]|nr:TIGR01777 family oxidoreductase [bacterium]